MKSPSITEALGLRPHPFRLLTLDGGGVRGIIQLIWIERLERHLGTPIHANVELIAGTSVGAVIGCAIAAGRSAEEIHGMWISSAHTAFAKPAHMADHLRRIAHLGGMAPKYLDDGLITMLKTVFGDLTMGELLRPTLALAYCPKSQSVHVFSSMSEEHKDLPVWEVCRASAAAPLFFSPYTMTINERGEKSPLLDGGVTAQNPVIIALSEALKSHRGKARTVNDVLVASFGTGESPSSKTITPKTIFGHQSLLLGALVRGASNTAEQSTVALLPSRNYYRFQVRLPDHLTPMDEADNVDELIELANAHLEHGADARLQALASRMSGKKHGAKPSAKPGWWSRLMHPGASSAALLGLGLLAALAPPPSSAAGFALIERDAAGLGRAFAGQAAITSAASLSANPAALPQAPTLSASLSALNNQLDATDARGERAEAGVDALIPAAYGAWKGIGLSLDVPFGLATRYPDDWSGRRAALDSEIRSARLSLGGGLAVAPGLRLGAALFAQHFSADLSNAVMLAPGLEERIQVDGADIGLGFGLGGLWQPRDGLAIGLGYTSPVWHQLTGSAALPALLGDQADTRVQVVTPESLRLGLDWQAAARWRLLAGAEWTRWSRLEALDIELSNGLRLSEDHQWRDSWRLSLGGEHQRAPWTFRAGLAWDQSPVPDAAHRYPRLPDSDRTWLSAGLGYRTGPWQLDAGLAYLIFAERDGDHPALSYTSDTSILALGLTRTW